MTAEQVVRSIELAAGRRAGVEGGGRAPDRRRIARWLDPLADPAVQELLFSLVAAEVGESPAVQRTIAAWWQFGFAVGRLAEAGSRKQEERGGTS
jgi:hypothetical protein